MKKIQFDWLKIVSLVVIAVVFILSFIPINRIGTTVGPTTPGTEPTIEYSFHSFVTLAPSLFTGNFPVGPLYAIMFVLFYILLIATTALLLFDIKFWFKLIGVLCAVSVVTIASPYSGVILYSLIAGVAILATILLNMFVNLFRDRKELLENHMNNKYTEPPEEES